MNMAQAFLNDDRVQGFKPLKHLGFSIHNGLQQTL